MWTRKELKDKAKVSFRANYWKTVLVALLVMVAIGGAGGFTWVMRAPIASTSAHNTASVSANNVNVEISDGKVNVDVEGDGGKVHVSRDADDSKDSPEAARDQSRHDDATNVNVMVGPAVVLVGLTVFLVVLAVMALVLAFVVFVFSPLEVGGMRYLLRNLNQRAEVKELAFAYDNNYLETVKTIFLRDIFIMLWSLLLIVPGIYKAYEYRMIPYLFAEDPTMTKDRAFAESKRMMDGQKWNTFVLDLSFLGWNILSAMTLGVLGVFYVGPYQMQTNAALYEKLRYGLPAPQPQPPYGAPAPMAAPPAGMPQQAQAQPVAAPVAASVTQPPVPPFAQATQPVQPAVAQVVAPLPQSQPAQSAVAQTAPLPQGQPAAPAVAQTAPLPQSQPDTTAPLPEPGVASTAPLPAGPESGKADSAPTAGPESGEADSAKA